MKVELSVASIIEALHNARQINDETYLKVIKELSKGENANSGPSRPLAR